MLCWRAVNQSSVNWSSFYTTTRLRGTLTEIFRKHHFQQFSIIKYLLDHSPENSRTWSLHLRYISKMYGLKDPLQCLSSDPPPKSIFKEQVLTKITSFHERELREAAAANSQMRYLNVSVLGLRGRLHPSITNVSTTHAVKKMRPHIKMLTGNYLTFQEKSRQSGGDPSCRLCFNIQGATCEPETLEHRISR